MAVQLLGMGNVGGGLQTRDADNKDNGMLKLSATTMSDPPRQASSHPLLVVLPCMVLARVAQSLWTSALCLQVLLEWFLCTW